MTPPVPGGMLTQHPDAGGDMDYARIVEVLAWAGDNEHPVRITTEDRAEVVGVPTSLDTHITAHEVFLRPGGADDTEIAISLGSIRGVELL